SSRPRPSRRGPSPTWQSPRTSPGPLSGYRTCLASCSTICALTNVSSLTVPWYICQGIYMDKRLQRLERTFRALADTTRLRIVGLLLTGEVCVCHIHESLRIPQPKASRHLAYLRKAGLVQARREGLWMHYRLAELPDPLLQAV